MMNEILPGTHAAWVGQRIRFRSPISKELVVGWIKALDAAYPNTAYQVSWNVAENPGEEAAAAQDPYHAGAKGFAAALHHRRVMLVD